MIVLDTNVLSELTRPKPDKRVLAWLDAQRPGDLSITAVTAAELLYGVARLPDGKRKAGLDRAVSEMLGTDFAGQTLAFDAAAAALYARLVVMRERAGRAIGMAGAQIAAICLAHGAALATRNVGDFEALSLDLIDSWQLT